MTHERSNPIEQREPSAEAHREDIRCIEQLGIHDLAGKAQLVWTLVGEQPAIDLYVHDGDENPDDIVKKLEAMGLVVRRTEHVRPGKAVNKETILWIAKTADEADALLATHSESGPRTEHEAYARLMGFPQTAIDAFLGRIPQLPEKKRVALWRHIEVRFPAVIVGMRVSQDHWKDEVRFILHRSKIIQEQAPDLYRQIVTERENAKKPTNP
jgi:hypothetical protein